MKEENCPTCGSRLSAQPGEGQWVPKDTIEVIRTIHATLKRGEDTEDHGIVGNLRCILDHVTSDLPDPSAPSHHSGAVVDVEKQITSILSCVNYDMREAVEKDLRSLLRHPSSTGAEESPPASEQGWVSVLDKLPDERRKLLVTNNITALDAFGEMSHVYLVTMLHPQEDGSYQAFDCADSTVRDITHWKYALSPKPGVEQLTEELREAEQLIAHAVEIMTPEQVGQWTGVRAFQERVITQEKAP